MHHQRFIFAVTVAAAVSLPCLAADLPFTVHNVSVDGLDLFYREAGCAEDPLVLLLHGSPDSSFMFRDLIPYLADSGYHVLAPDYPGFGFTVVPESRNYNYTFDSLTTTVDLWLHSLNISSFSIYMHDIGAPVGFNLALKNEYNITAIVNQNAPAYTDAIGPGLDALIDYANDPNNQTLLQGALQGQSPAAIAQLYLSGVPDPSMVAPESYALDNALLAMPGRMDSQLSFTRDVPAFIAAFPSWQAWLRQHQPPLLAIWGKGDPALFAAAGASAFQRDVPNAEVVLVDAGHFALETALVQVGSRAVSFLKSNGI